MFFFNKISCSKTTELYISVPKNHEKCSIKCKTTLITLQTWNKQVIFCLQRKRGEVSCIECTTPAAYTGATEEDPTESKSSGISVMLYVPYYWTNCKDNAKWRVIIIWDNLRLFFNWIWHCFLQQDETSQRHQENLQQIREKAFEMSILKHSTEEHNEAPNVVPYDHKKLCTICNVLVSVVWDACSLVWFILAFLHFF